MVWTALAASMTTVGGLLYLAAGDARPALGGRAITPLMQLSAPSSLESIYATDAELADTQWDAIVIHHSGSPVCSPESLGRDHRAAGLDGLGYHFVIGNGRRMADGEIHLGYRWLRQLPGAHVAGPSGVDMNRRALGVCLVGDGDRRPFTRLQAQRVVELVRSLQQRFGIPASAVHLHRDLAATASPGQHFPEAELRRALASIPG